MDEGSITVYFGDGAGKSSAALGAAMRCASKGGTAYVIQFLKGQIESEYVKRLEPELKFFRFERSLEVYDSRSEQERIDDKVNISNGINFARKVLSTGECDLLVLDEVLGAVGEGMLDESELAQALDARAPGMQVILTGRPLMEAVLDKADYVYEIVPEQSRDDIEKEENPVKWTESGY